jgi:hypothetical protein
VGIRQRFGELGSLPRFRGGVPGLSAKIAKGGMRWTWD